jgi:hypothetical protein
MGKACWTHGGRGMHIGFCWESPKETDHYEFLDVGKNNIKTDFR